MLVFTVFSTKRKSSCILHTLKLLLSVNKTGQPVEPLPPEFPTGAFWSAKFLNGTHTWVKPNQRTSLIMFTCILKKTPPSPGLNQIPQKTSKGSTNYSTQGENVWQSLVRIISTPSFILIHKSKRLAYSLKLSRGVYLFYLESPLQFSTKINPQHFGRSWQRGFEIPHVCSLTVHVLKQERE